MLPGRLFLLLALAFAARAAFTAEAPPPPNLHVENVPPVPAALLARMAMYQDARAATFVEWDPHGRGLLISARVGDTAQLHYVDRAGGAWRPLTAGTDPVIFASFAPHAAWRGLVFMRDRGGDEFFQLYWLDLATRRETLLTDGASRNGPPLWTHRGDRFVYTSTRRNGRDTDLYVVTLQRLGESQLLLERTGSWAVLDWSPDDRRLLLREVRSGSDARLYVLDLGASQLIPLNPRPPDAEKIVYGRAVWSHDGDGVFFVSNEDSEFLQLRYWDGLMGRQKVLTADIPWDITQLARSRDGGTVAFTANENGISTLYLLDTWSHQHSRVTTLPKGTISSLGFSPDSRSVAVTLDTPQTPGDVYVVRVGNRRVTRWTTTDLGELDPAKFTPPAMIAYPTFDEHARHQRRLIPALVYRPARLAPDSRAPVLISIHGGPESQAVVGFNPLTQFLVNELGLVVIQPNVRGSAGYGKTFTSLDNGFQREDAVKDIGALLDWIAQQPDLDARRVAVFGGSYGGFMALAALARYPDRLAAGVALSGISDFTTFLTHTQDYRRDLRRQEYGDERDPEMHAFLARISPLAQVARLTPPMLLAHGANDPRVPASEAEQLVAALARQGARPWFILARDEGHGFARRPNRDFVQSAMALFLRKHLCTADPPAIAAQARPPAPSSPAAGLAVETRDGREAPRPQ